MVFHAFPVEPETGLGIYTYVAQVCMYFYVYLKYTPKYTYVVIKT